MSEYPNSGIILRNTYKKPGSKAPDATGSCRATCLHCQKETEFEIAAWIRVGNSGKKFTTLRFTEKGEAQRKKAEAKAKKAGLPVEGAAAPAEPEPKGQPGEDNIPF